MENRPIETTQAQPAVPAEDAETQGTGRLTEYAWAILLIVVSLWGISILSFGLPGLVVPALVLLPGIFVLLLLITMGG
ncbi:MAG: hypothetical protein AAF281_12705 [Pseudomonadota bacterium]